MPIQRMLATFYCKESIPEQYPGHFQLTKTKHDRRHGLHQRHIQCLQIRSAGGSVYTVLGMGLGFSYLSLTLITEKGSGVLLTNSRDNQTQRGQDYEGQRSYNGRASILTCLSLTPETKPFPLHETASKLSENGKGVFSLYGRTFHLKLGKLSQQKKVYGILPIAMLTFTF